MGELQAWPDFVCASAVHSLFSTEELNRPSRRPQLQQRESGVRILLRRATWLFPQLYEMPNRAKGSQEATATAIIAVSGLVWVALP